MKKLKPMLISISVISLIAGTLAGVKIIQIGRMSAQAATFVPPPETVNTADVAVYEWGSVLTAVGSLEAVHGVEVAAELPGRVSRIVFEAGSRAREGDLLLQQDITAELAEERSAQSEVTLAQKIFDRNEALKKNGFATDTVFDESRARYEKAIARLDSIRAVIAKKTIRAPFSGRLGIRQVNLGRILEPGQPIVSLQSLDPIYVNFLLPQHRLELLQNGLTVRVSTGSGQETPVTGTITAINSEVDKASRNIKVQATLKNPDEKMKPGMYATVTVVLPRKQSVVAIPATAVLYAPYSDSVFVVEKNQGGDGQKVRQQFVQLGQKHGDFVVVHSGLEIGNKVVTTGVFKLRNGQSVVVDNSVTPEFNLNPQPGNS